MFAVAAWVPGGGLDAQTLIAAELATGVYPLVLGEAAVRK